MPQELVRCHCCRWPLEQATADRCAVCHDLARTEPTLLPGQMARLALDAHARRLLQEGLSRALVWRRLVTAGYDPDLAAATLRAVADGAAADTPAEGTPLPVQVLATAPTGPAQPARRPNAGGRAWPWTVLVLIALNVAAYLGQVWAGGHWLEHSTAVLLKCGADYPPLTWAGEPWRVVTAGFLHGDLPHLFGNLWFLLAIGAALEKRLGGGRLLMVYLGALLTGAAFTCGWHPAAIGVGASGAIFGVFGAALAFLPGRPAKERWRPLGLFALYGGFQLLHGWLALEANLPAHLGGCLFGLCAGILFRLAGAGQRVAAEWARTMAAVALLSLGLVGVALGVAVCCRAQVKALAALTPAVKWELAILADMEDLLKQEEDGRLSERELAAAWETKVVRPLAALRSALPGATGGRLPFTAEGRVDPGATLDLPPEADAKQPATAAELEQYYRFYVALLDDGCRQLHATMTDHPERLPFALGLLTMAREVRHELEERAGAGSKLRQWIPLAKGRKTKKQ